MDLIEGQTPADIHQTPCPCSACSFQPTLTPILQASDISLPNSLHSLLSLLPSSFPLLLEQTIVVQPQEQGRTFRTQGKAFKAEGRKEFICYCNSSREDRKTWRTLRYQTKGVGGLAAANLQVYFGHSQKLLPRHEAANIFSSLRSERIQFEEDVLYVQPYQPRPIVRVSYNHIRPLDDNLLRQNLQKEFDRLRKPHFKINEDILEWIHRQYGEDTFCQYLVELYVGFFRILTSHTILQAVFFWTLHPLDSVYSSPGSHWKTEYQEQRNTGKPRILGFRPKLVNVRGLQVQIHQQLYSFQEQFTDKIREKIHSSSRKMVTAVKDKAYRIRLEQFRNRLQQTYSQEQQTVLQKVEPEKQFEFQHDSQKMARMLIPNMAPYHSLKEIINSQEAFKHVFGRKNRLPSQPSGPHRKHIRRATEMVNPQNDRQRSKQSLILEETLRKRYGKLLRTPSTAS